jgi:dolichyl-phosphate-mannose--protein O-mannosyl transferase
LFNNFVYVMSRVAMMDIFLIGFLIWGLVAFTAVLQVNSLTTRKRRALLGFAGVMFGFACACKWNGVDTLGIVVLISSAFWFVPIRLQNEEMVRCGRNLREAGIVFASISLLVVPIVAYSLTFWILCRGIHLPFSIRQLVEMNAFIWRFHKAVPGNAAIAVPWYLWPFQAGPQRALSYLVGNWVIMWGGLLALGFCLVRGWNRLPEVLLVTLYVGNLLQWALTPQRLLYYYYYFPAAMFLGAAIPVALRRLPSRILGLRLSVVCTIAAGCAFLYCFPHMAYMEAPFDCALGCWP